MVEAVANVGIDFPTAEKERSILSAIVREIWALGRSPRTTMWASGASVTALLVALVMDE